MRVAILVPWIGELPAWCVEFLGRFDDYPRSISFRVIQIKHWRHVAKRIADTTGVHPPMTIEPRKLCDYRPAFGMMFSDAACDPDWWGWSDLDCVFGDLPAFLTPERLLEYDLITDHASIVNGPFSIMRNSEKMRTLYQRHPNWREIFSSSEHAAFDEVGFTEVVQSSPDVRALYLDAHHHDREPGTPELRGGKLFVGDREILAHHFASAKRWPEWAS